MFGKIKQTVFRWLAIYKLKDMSSEYMYTIIKKQVFEADLDEDIKRAFLKRLKQLLK